MNNPFISQKNSFISTKNPFISAKNPIIPTKNHFDAILESMRQSNQAFYCYYPNARTIKKSGGAKVAAKGKVFDSVTKQPMPGAQMSIVPYNSNLKLALGCELVKNVKIKSASGGFQLKSLPTGTYLFKVTYSGYKNQETIVYINEGILTQYEVPLDIIVKSA